MKKLLLMRHAKSDWSTPGQQDFDRPLNERGVKSARLVGEYIRKHGIRPGLIISSPARRTRQTIALVMESAHLAAELRYDERIYEASAERLFAVVSQVEDSVNDLMLVGHNPGMSELLLALAGENRHMPTAALASLSLDIEKWNKFQEQRGRLEWLIKPKELSNG
ncbi:MAG: histidine phosphatase family protein [Acidobacteria bacterium]|nr:histidine phosphatase family protein [Acidobacteriota bacterium]